MSEQYIGEVRAVGFSFAPRGWALCNGQLMAINQNQALFSLLGTQFGGDGIRTFGLPNLMGRTPTSYGGSVAMGEIDGTEAVTMTVNQLPLHNHLVTASTATATASDPTGEVWGPVTDSLGIANMAFTEATPNVTMSPSALSTTGASTPIPVLQPYTVVNFIIATTGIFPSRG